MSRLIVVLGRLSATQDDDLRLVDCELRSAEAFTRSTVPLISVDLRLFRVDRTPLQICIYSS